MGISFFAERKPPEGLQRTRNQSQCFVVIPFGMGITTDGEYTDGRLYCDLTDEMLSRLDFFEDDLYDRQLLDVSTSKERMKAFVYIVPPEQKSLLTSIPWDEELFVSQHLEKYLVRARKWMERFGT